jgi:hypothetical protein
VIRLNLSIPVPKFTRAESAYFLVLCVLFACLALPLPGSPSEFFTAIAENPTGAMRDAARVMLTVWLLWFATDLMIAAGLGALRWLGRLFSQGASMPPTGPVPVTCVTPASIEAKVRGCEYYVWPGTTLTLCLLTLENGTVVVGESACADPANFDQAKGEKYAREDAIEKVWPREGYLLKQRLSGLPL